MGTLALCAVLFLAFYNSAAAVSRDSGCSKLERCSRIIARCPNFMEIITKKKVHNAVCRRFPKVARCVRAHEKSCSDPQVSYDAAALRDILHYTCTGKGRRLIHTLHESQCAEDLQSLEVKVFHCIQEFEMSVLADTLQLAQAKETLCPHVRELDHCLIHGSYRLCGKDWGRFVADVWRIFSQDEMAQFGCHDRHIRLRRAAIVAREMIQRGSGR